MLKVGIEYKKKFFAMKFEQIGSIKPALNDIADYFQEKMIPQHFASDGVRGGARWPNLHPATIVRITRSRSGMLDVSGKLKFSLMGKNSDSIREVNALSVELGTRTRYAKWQHEGTKTVVTAKQRMWMGMNLGIWKKVGSIKIMPARPVYSVTRLDREFFTKKIGNNIVKNLSK